ncbi:MAG TPA: bifunctional adenosylcobinamide kinase/adenosylcobinamide-phosphate guanylyltransferase [Candidatus Coprocola pullicola]|nr:bifunctional adenosylcobinamide kinase/adenosylcobinamide-phosphate guanylyltransferase [Candidatus Coprocola pullicola]
MILVTGGDRSGKSVFAEKLASNYETVLYIATAEAFDEEMKKRIQKHQNRRPSHWDTLESYQNLAESIKQKQKDYDCILLDCVTLLLTNLLFLYSHTKDVEKMDFENLEKKLLQEIEEIAHICQKAKKQIIIVTVEMGLGIVPAEPLSRHFRDIMGTANQILAQKAQEVYFVVSGIPMKIKGE